MTKLGRGRWRDVHEDDGNLFFSPDIG